MGRLDYETETLIPCVTGQVTHTLKADGFDASEDGTGRGTPIVPVSFDLQQITSKANMTRVDAGLPVSTLAARSDMCVAYSAIAFQSSQSGVRLGDVHATLDSSNGPRRHNGALVGMQVRRLTPRECERLQAFPDDHTLITVRGKPAADGPRYKALGNSMCVNVMAWIGKQIDHVVMFY